MEPRSRGKTMEEVGYDWITEREVSFYLDLDSECPINEEKLVGLLKSLRSLDTFGPAKRGHIEVTSLKEVKAS